MTRAEAYGVVAEGLREMRSAKAAKFWIGSGRVDEMLSALKVLAGGEHFGCYLCFSGKHTDDYGHADICEEVRRDCLEKVGE